MESSNGEPSRAGETSTDLVLSSEGTFCGCCCMRMRPSASRLLHGRCFCPEYGTIAPPEPRLPEPVPSALDLSPGGPPFLSAIAAAPRHHGAFHAYHLQLGADSTRRTDGHHDDAVWYYFAWLVGIFSMLVP